MYIGVQESGLNQAHDSLATVFASFSILCLIVATMGIKFRWFRHQLVFDGSPAAKSDHQSLNNPASTSYGVYRSKAVDEDFEEPVQLRNPQPSTSQNASKKQYHHESIFRFPFKNKLSVSKFGASAPSNEPAISFIQAKQENLTEDPQKSAETLRKNEKIRRMVSETLDRNSLNISKAPSENSNTTGIPLNVEYSKIVAHSVKTEPSIITENPKPVENFNSLNSEVSSPSEGVTVREKRSSDPLTISAPMPPKRTSREPPLARPRLRATETLENDVQETIDFGEENVELFKKVRIIPKSVRPQEVNVNGVEPAVQTSVSEKETKDAEVVVNKVPEIILTDSEDKLFEPRGNKTSVNIAELVSDFSDDDDIDPIDIILIESKSAAPKSEPTPISNGMLPPPSVDIRNSPKASVSFKPDIETISNSSYSSLEEFVQSSSEFYVDLPRNDAQTPSQLKSILKPDDKESLEEEYEDDMFNSWVRVDKHRKQLDNWQHSKLPPPLPKTPPPTLEEEYIFDDSPLPVRSRESLI